MVILCKTLQKAMQLVFSQFFSKSISDSTLICMTFAAKTTMLDTVILTIPKSAVRTLDPIQSRTPAWDLHTRTGNYEKYVKNPTAADKRNGIYKPRLTGFKRRIVGQTYHSFIKIEFSVPKLLFGNNLSEVDERDFPKVIDTLRQRLLEMGVIVAKGDLEIASVSALHVSKNIVLSDGYTASLVAKELGKINLNRKFDLSKTNFRNSGQSLQGYTIAHSIVFYDKIADLSQPKKRAIDKDPAPQQLSLFEAIKKRQPSLEILRMEVRLSQKQKLNAVLVSLGFKKDPMFREIFKKELCQKIVQSYWSTLIKGENLFLFELTTAPKRLLKDLLRVGVRAKEAVYLVGLSVLCKDEGGIRDLRQTLERALTQRGWYRISEGLKRINSMTSPKAIHGWVGQIETAIKEFTSYKVRSP